MHGKQAKSCPVEGVARIWDVQIREVQLYKVKMSEGRLALPANP